MLTGFDRAGFGPGKQFIGGDGALPHFQMLLRVVRDAFGELVGIRQQKVDVEGPRSVEHPDCGIEGGSFAGIGSSLPAVTQIKEEFRGAGRLSHLAVLLTRTKVLDAPSVLLLSLVVKLFRLRMIQLRTCF